MAYGGWEVKPGVRKKSFGRCSSSFPTKTTKPWRVAMMSPRLRVGSFIARWLAASASSFSDGAGIAAFMRAFATNSSDRRRASSTRCCHFSRVSAESEKSSSAWLKQHADDEISDQATIRVVVQIVMTWTLRVWANPHWGAHLTYCRREK